MRINDLSYLTCGYSSVVDLGYRKKMTYIVAGKLNNEPFLMVDSIVSNSENENKEFKIKLRKLDSVSNTYFCITGHSLLSAVIEEYNYWLSINNGVFYINSSDTIDEILKLFLHFNNNTLESYQIKKIYTNQRIFFINNESVIVYEIKYYDGVFTHKKIELLDNETIDSTISNPKKTIKFKTELSIYDNCVKYLDSLVVNHIWSNPSIEVKFDNRFSFIHFQNKEIKDIKYPLKNINELIYDYYPLDYNKLISDKENEK